jgi:signal transduction histidine kinase
MMPPALPAAQTILDRLPYALMLLDGTGTIRYLNPRMGHLLRIDPSTLIGSAFADHPFGRDHAALQEFDVWEFDHQQRRATVWATAIERATAAPTLRQSARSQLGTLIQMTTAAHEWSSRDLLRNFLHESLTPLAAIHGYVELLLGDAAGPLSGAQRQMVEAIHLQIEYVLTLRQEVFTQVRLLLQYHQPPSETCD